MNAEADILNYIYQAREDGVASIIINLNIYIYTSVIICDALLKVRILFIEVHINPYTQETSRYYNYLTNKASAVICGVVVYGYFAALDWWAWILSGESVI